jgi:uncharacterized membrane protein YphA (DoxX/SURF4 family)
MKYFIIALRILVAAILLQTLYFKFSGAPESIYIFSTLGVEPFGRWFAGFSELIASAMILIPALQTMGAMMAAGIMVGAIFSHLFVLGIVVQNDGGLLFCLALTVFVCSLIICFIQRAHIFALASRAKGLAQGYKS